MTHAVPIDVDDDVLLDLQQTPEEFAGEMRLAAAVKWYELGRISQERAAQIAGLSRAAFIDELAHFRVSPFQETAEDILHAAQGG